MRYRTKIYLASIFLVLTSGSLTSFMIYFETRDILLEQIRSTVLSIAATTSVLIDPNLIDTFTKQSDIYNPSFIDLKDHLRKIRNVNRRGDIYVLYNFIIRPDPQRSNEMLFVADSTFNPKISVYPGQEYTEVNETGVLEHLLEYYSPPQFTTDRWGKYLSTFVPIVNEEGKYVATLGINVREVDVLARLKELLALSFITLLGALVLGIVIAFFLASFLTKTLSTLSESVQKIGKGDLDHQCQISSSDEFGNLSVAINEMTRGLKERETIKSSFAKYVSEPVLEKTLQSKEEVQLQGERKYITVLFSDIPNFSQICEKLQPSEIVSFLNEFLSRMLEVIIKNGATIDKFIGEGIMAFFGAPLEDKDQERKAAATAVEMQKALGQLHEKWKGECRPVIDLRIGIHSGNAVVGNIGSYQRMEYTAIGDTVNTSARLMEYAKKKEQKILLSEETAQKIKNEFDIKEFETLVLPGRTSETKVFLINI